MPDRLLLSVVPEVSTALGIGRTTAWGLVDSGQLPSVRLGRRRLVPAEALKTYVDRLMADQGNTPDAA